MRRNHVRKEVTKHNDEMEEKLEDRRHQTQNNSMAFKTLHRFSLIPMGKRLSPATPQVLELELTVAGRQPS